MIRLLIVLLCVWQGLNAQTTFEVEQQVFELINQHRSSIGLNALIKSDIIFTESRKHSAGMAAGRVNYGHDGFSNRAGVIRRVTRCGMMGENVNYTWGKDVARRAVNSWLNSKGHRENIEKPNFTISGVGVAKDRSGMFYLTQIFGVKRLN